MNKVILIGRLTADPVIRSSQDGMSIARFNLAVDRRKKDEADFPSCIAFSKTAEFIEKYFHKGNKIAITGRIQTGSYTDKDGKKVYTTEVVVDECEFVESKGTQAEAPKVDENGFMAIPDAIDEELPFV